MKKDVYEHLAKTFLGKKSKRKIKSREFFVFAVLIVIFCFLTIFGLGSLLIKRGVYTKSIYVIEDKTPIEIGYDFSTMGDNKVKAISFNLNEIDLKEYNTLSISIRTRADASVESSIKVQIENSLLEKGEEYISGISSRWKEFTVPFSDFEKISDWASISSLTFVVEEWNITNKNDTVYIDDVKFITKKTSN